MKLFQVFRTKSSRRESARPAEYLKSFREKQETEQAYDARSLGVKSVSLDRIVGSVGRYHDFDGEFRPRSPARSERLEEIREAMKSGKNTPPVSLYQIKDDYYIMDGNHRVAAAKSLGRDEIQARILEFLPSTDTLENLLYREKSQFVETSGLTAPIILTEVGQYRYLLQQIEKHRAALSRVSGTETTAEAAAQDWYRTIYQPMVAMIEKADLLRAFPGRTLGDLYTYISWCQWEQGKKREYGTDLDAIIPKSMEAFRARILETEGSSLPEMKRSITAFVLINVQAGTEYQVIDRIFELNEVREVYDVPGDFDLLVKIEIERDWLSSDSEVLGWYLYSHIRQLEGVVRTKTLLPTRSRIKSG